MAVSVGPSGSTFSIAGDALLKQVITQAAGVNWITVVERIVREIKRAGDEDRDAIKQSICTSMDFWRPHRFDFNEVTGYWWALEDVYEYRGVSDRWTGEVPQKPESGDESIPIDIVKTDVLKVKGEDDDWWSRPLEQVTVQELRYWRRTDNHSGTPRYYAWYDDGIDIYPTPNRDFIVKMDYVRDLGVVRYQYDETSGWTYFEPFTGAILSNSYINEWFTHAEELIRLRAKWDLYTNYLEDQKSADRTERATRIVLNNMRKGSLGKRKNVSRVPTPV